MKHRESIQSLPFKLVDSRCWRSALLIPLFLHPFLKAFPPISLPLPNLRHLY